MQITIDEAIKHLDNAARKFAGTRDDHAVLQASTQLVSRVVNEWKVLKQEKADAARAEAEAKKNRDNLTPIDGGGSDNDTDGDATPPADNGTPPAEAGETGGE